MTANVEALEDKSDASTADRVADLIRRAAHASHQAHLFRSVAEDAIESGVHAARRAVKQRVREVEDMADDAALRIRRRPLAAVGAALGVGLALGVIVGWLARRACPRV